MRHRHPLSKRELEILSLVAAGYTDPEISAKLDISYYTVKTHTKKILYKLRSKTRAQAVFTAIGEGYYLG
jgi:DNA-binding CsgD family transcriptional regulator